MIITYNGAQSFKVQHGNSIIALDPISKDSTHKPTKFGADVAVSSINHPDCNGFETVTHGDKKPFRIQGPGAYEVKEIFIRGFPTVSTYGGVERINTLYTIHIEGMDLCFLGALDEAKMSSKIAEEIENVDVLFVPIGGDGVLDPASAYKLAVSLEPSIIIPMNYGQKDKDGVLKTFLKEGSYEEVKPIEKLTIKKKDLLGKDAEIVILKQS